MQTDARRSKLRIAGWALWRGGLVIAALAAFYYAAWWWVSQLDVPTPITLSVSLALTGCVLILLSLLLERRKDARIEGDLAD